MASERVPSTVPASAVEFGAGLRALRTRGLRRLEHDQVRSRRPIVISKSQLARYESGHTLPALEHASQLDELYQADGWVVMSLRSLWRRKWDPWASDASPASRYHASMWPAPYGGMVWVKLVPTDQNVGRDFKIWIEWGPWGREVLCRVPSEGVVLLTGKAVDSDGISRTFNLTADAPLFALFGAGDNLDGDDVLDIRRGWNLVNPMADKAEHGHGPDTDD